jgi:hypothetical protein
MAPIKPRISAPAGSSPFEDRYHAVIRCIGRIIGIGHGILRIEFAPLDDNEADFFGCDRQAWGIGHGSPQPERGKNAYAGIGMNSACHWAWTHVESFSGLSSPAIGV